MRRLTLLALCLAIAVLTSALVEKPAVGSEDTRWDVETAPSGYCHDYISMVHGYCPEVGDPPDDKLLFITRTPGHLAVDPGTGQEVFTPDPDSGTKFVYDEPDYLPTRIEYPTSSQSLHFTYDGYGRLSETWDGPDSAAPTTGNKKYDYDDLDLVTGVTSTYRDVNVPDTFLLPKTVSYGYYNNGSISAVTVPTPSGTGSFSYDYDLFGRPTGLTNPFGEAFSWEYESNGWLKTQTLRNYSGQEGFVAQTLYTYNARGFLTNLANQFAGGPSEFRGSQSQGTPIVYDAVGNLLSMYADVPGLAGLTTYAYDTSGPRAPRDWLSGEQSTRGSGYSNTFEYDNAGNPTTFRGASEGFNENNQRNDAGFAYDHRGNPTTYKAVSNLSYDMENRLTSYGSLLSAGYTCDGLRAYKKSAADTTYFLYDGTTPVCELDASGNVTAINTFGANGLLSRGDGTSPSLFYTFDPQGNVAQTVMSDGTVGSTLLYDAYGTLLHGTASYPYGFGAQYGYYAD